MSQYLVTRGSLFSRPTKKTISQMTVTRSTNVVLFLISCITPAIQLQRVAAEHGATQGATRRRRSFVSCNGLLGRCASLVGLQRYVDTDRVPNDGVSGPCYLPNDLTPAFANLSKTLREVVDGQTK